MSFFPPEDREESAARQAAVFIAFVLLIAAFFAGVFWAGHDAIPDTVFRR